MATQTISYGTKTDLTWTPASLANGSYDFSAAIDNSTDLAVDGLVSGKITTGTSPTTGNTITLYLYGEDGNGQYTAGLSGSDGGTPGAGEQTQLPILTVIPVDSTSNHTYEYGPIAVAQFFGGILPRKWGVGCLNSTGVALNATAGNHVCSYQTVKYTVA
ncbi:MAG TPA: hypothetical protein VI653_14885 [Steroidobacteraceae bacterium]